MIVRNKNVIVVGGGMAGISAAIELSKHHGVHVTLVEAQDRLGGRVYTHRNLVRPSFESDGLVPQGSADIALDFGASWIHGVDPSNPLDPLIKTGHVEYVHTDSDVMYLQPGSSPLLEDESNHYWKIVWDILDEAKEYSTEHRHHIPEDLSLRDWMTQYIGAYQSEDPEGEKYMSELTKTVVRGLSLYWADENAIPMEEVSMKYMDSEEIFPGEHCLVTNGYDRMVKALASQLKDVRVFLEHVVDKIEYNEFEVKVSTNHGTFRADQVLITLPLGVLKSQSKTLFSPQLPIPKQRAVDQLGFGTIDNQPNPELVSRFNLNLQQLEALTAYMHDMANYSSFMPVYDKPILVGYATNHAAELMERLSDSEARMVYLCHLAHYFDALVNDNSPEEGEALWAKVSFMTRWNQDPFTRGSYTSIPVGASPADIEEFQIPVSARVYGQLAGDDDYEHCENDDDDDDVVEKKSVGPSAAVALMSVNDPETGRVFFAGEHTLSGHFASVQGAILSGHLGASKILGQEHSHEH
ncbi:hypothetical protein BGX20_011282 [Mortierella sp. AD010]|nr:hypothetical protein BGX20_011282 [Mortierella sp. AD010]